jgi:hypothetical protein
MHSFHFQSILVWRDGPILLWLVPELRMTPNNEETKKKIVDTSQRIQVAKDAPFCYFS